MYAQGVFGPLTKIVVGFLHELPDGTQVVRGYAGIVTDGQVTVDYDSVPVNLGMYIAEIPTGRKTVHLDVVFDLHDMGATMKTWADIRSPAAEIENRKVIEQ